MQTEDTLVIGAGPAGLAVSACLRREGVAHGVLERERTIGSAWHRHYDRLHLHTTKTYSGLPMRPWPKAAPRYPSREQVLQYLQAYAAEHHIAPRLGVTVHTLKRTGDRFTVDTSAGVMTPRIVVMATGYNGVPKLPSVPGLDSLPLGLRDAIAMGAMRLVVGDLSRWGIVRPAVGPNRMIEESGRIPILDTGTIAMVKQGQIRVLPAVQEILPDSVRFAGGAVHPFEALIFATGYATGLVKVIEGFETIADARGRPLRFGQESGIAGLYFVGFKNPPTGALREIALEAPRVARSIRNIVGGDAAMAASATAAG